MRMIKSTTTLLVVNGMTWNTEMGGAVAGLSFVLWAIYLGLVMIEQMTGFLTTNHRDEEEREAFEQATQDRARRAQMAGRRMAASLHQPNKHELKAVIVKRTTTITDDTPTPGG